MWQTSMRYGAQINDNKEQSTLLRATLLCQRPQTAVHLRSNDNIDVLYDDSMFALYYTLHFEYFLEIRFIEYKLFTQGLCTSMLCRWVLSTIATSKAPWDKIDAQVKVVNYTSLQWTIDTCHRIIDSQRAPKRPFFFPLRTALCSLGSGMSLMMQSDSKMTHPAMCLDHHESNNFSTVYAWRIKFGHTYSYPYQYIYIYII
jgi:hypothetical protein